MANHGAVLQVKCPGDEDGLLELRAGSFQLRGKPALVLDGTELALTEVAPSAPASTRAATAGSRHAELTRTEGELSRASASIEYRFGADAVLALSLRHQGDATVTLSGRLTNCSGRPRVLSRVDLLRSAAGPPHCVLGTRPERVVSLEQGNYWGSARPLNAAADSPRSSDLVWAAYDREARSALLLGWITSERWLGRIALQQPSEPGGAALSAGIDGGDLVLEPNTPVELEELLVLAGPDAWTLLEEYAEASARRHPCQVPPKPVVSWCSWYPYRLGVSAERVLAEARIAAARLRPLGLSVMEVDLGWQAGNLPSTFTENERFAGGLDRLAAELAELGLDLGVWSALYSIAAGDPIAAQHPEWLIQDEAGRPARHSEWYWEPHGDVYVLDLTHPGAQELLAQRIASLRRRGVRYLKADFIGCASAAVAKRRHDPHLVAGGGVEAARRGAAIVREQLPNALLLNCGGPEAPGTGHWPLLYTCNDTGNTGFIQRSFQQENHQSLACHLFKNGRWGIIQPSCLCVGLPGSLEEARLRATAAFLAGGQIDISDTLTTLPEDRWAVLTATLPPLGQSARPVDLFEPVDDGGGFGYATTAHGEDAVAPSPNEHPPASDWHLRVDSGWDQWDLVGVFAFAGAADTEEPRISRFSIPLDRVGLKASPPCEAFEFWGGQYLGAVDGGRTNAGGYAHPGDMQDLLCGRRPDRLELAFFGPAARLLRLWQPRPHLWIAGTTFHQSCGGELREVRWDPAQGVLAGRIDRPTGDRGMLILCGGAACELDAAADGRSVPVRLGARGSVIVPLEVTHPGMEWRVRCRPQTAAPVAG